MNMLDALKLYIRLNRKQTPDIAKVMISRLGKNGYTHFLMVCGEILKLRKERQIKRKLNRLTRSHLL